MVQNDSEATKQSSELQTGSKKITKQQGHWNQIEHNTYLKFLQENANHTKGQRLFKKMSLVVGTRTPSQCRQEPIIQDRITKNLIHKRPNLLLRIQDYYGDPNNMPEATLLYTNNLMNLVIDVNFVYILKYCQFYLKIVSQLIKIQIIYQIQINFPSFSCYILSFYDSLHIIFQKYYSNFNLPHLLSFKLTFLLIIQLQLLYVLIKFPTFIFI
ncbi:unnamed protein product [Paramecium primaurelia]|uniref:Uncharacterized protein n=1 Tax=Paramecium primaurelia TaxID=5886 RepID=A0A8S1Q882_PARPR|nr:unnamed protein product [Paramecium primaurelia]